MSIFDDFIPYVDGNGLLAPNPVPAGVMRGSDNGPMYSSEYYIMLHKNTGENLCYRLEDVMLDCSDSNNYLVRAPGDDSLGNPDNHYGVYAACVELNVKPTFKFYWKLLRQPQLLFAHYCAKGYAKWYNLLLWPLASITGIIIATSCIGTDPNNTDARRLSWLLIQTTRPFSLQCKLASLL